MSLKIFRFKQPINLYCFTDVHIGHKGHDAKKFKKAIDAIKKDKNAYCFFNGDTIDFTPSGHHDATNEQDMTLEEQVENYIDLLKSLGKKVLFIRSGNHEDRQNKAIGLDLMKTIKKTVGNIHVMHGGYEECWIFIKGKKHRIVTSHGEGGGSGAVLQKLALAIPSADVYFTGHTHSFFCDVGYSPYMTDTGEMVRKLVHKIAGGSFQDAADYARTKNMISTQTGCYILKLNSYSITAEAFT